MIRRVFFCLIYEIRMNMIFGALKKLLITLLQILVVIRSSELYRFKNKANKLIIIYMGDERKGTAAATLMTEKGYENVFLLSGGIDGFNEEFHHLIEGREVPKPKS